MKILCFADFELNLESCELKRYGERVPLDPRPFDVLVYLIRNRVRVVHSEELVSNVWQQAVVSLSSVPTAINTIRKALGDDSRRPRFVETVHRRGYRFIAPLRVQLPHTYPDSFVGRYSEIALLEEYLASTASGTGGLILISGPSGIGKTRLAHEFACVASGQDYSTIVVTCGTSLPCPAFWPWVQLLNDCSQLLAPATLETGKDLLSHIAPPCDPTSALADYNDPSRRAWVFRRIIDFLAALSKESRLLLVLDDLHQADPSSLALLEAVATELHRIPALFLALHREPKLPDDDSARQIERLAALSVARQFTLEGLTIADLRAFLQRENLPADHLLDLAGRLRDITCGNPLFLSHLLQEIKAGRQVISASGQVNVPNAIRSVLREQFDSLPDATRLLLQAASVVGQAVPLHLLAHLTNLPTQEALLFLQPALTARLLTFQSDGPSISFCHVLLRDTIYEDLPAAVRADIHRRVAYALEEICREALGPHASEIAAHFRASGVLGAVKAVDYSIRASEWSARCLAYEDAPLHLRNALESLDAAAPGDLRRRAEILLRLGDAEMRAGQRQSGRKSLTDAARLAKELHDGPLVGHSALAMAPGFFAHEFGVIDHSLIALLEEALGSLTSADCGLRARLLARLALALNSTDAAQRAARLSAEAMLLAKQAGDETTLAAALSTRHAVLWGPENAHERLRNATRLVELAARNGDIETALVYRLFRLTDLIELGDRAGSQSECDAFEALVREFDFPQARWYVPLFRALWCHLAGSLTEVEVTASEILRLGHQVQDRNAFLCFALHMTFVRLEQGRFDELAGTIDGLRDEFRPLRQACGCLLAFARSELGQREQAYRELHNGTEPHVTEIPRNALWLATMNAFGGVAACLGELDLCDAIYRLLLPYEDRIAVVGYAAMCLGSVSRPLGMMAAAMGEFEASEHHFEHAIAVNGRLGATLWILYSQYYYARMLLARGSPQDLRKARSFAGEGSQAAEALGLRNLHQNLRDLAQQIEAGSPVRYSHLATPPPPA